MSRKITVRCDSCAATLAVAETAAGRRVRCPKCKTVVEVPSERPMRDSGMPSHHAQPPLLPGGDDEGDGADDWTSGDENDNPGWASESGWKSPVPVPSKSKDKRDVKATVRSSRTKNESPASPEIPRSRGLFLAAVWGPTVVVIIAAVVFVWFDISRRKKNRIESANNAFIEAAGRLSSDIPMLTASHIESHISQLIEVKKNPDLSLGNLEVANLLTAQILPELKKPNSDLSGLIIRLNEWKRLSPATFSPEVETLLHFLKICETPASFAAVVQSEAGDSPVSNEVLQFARMLFGICSLTYSGPADPLERHARKNVFWAVWKETIAQKPLISEHIAGMLIDRVQSPVFMESVYAILWFSGPSINGKERTVSLESSGDTLTVAVVEGHLHTDKAGYLTQRWRDGFARVNNLEYHLMHFANDNLTLKWWDAVSSQSDQLAIQWDPKDFRIFTSKEVAVEATRLFEQNRGALQSSEGDTVHGAVAVRLVGNARQIAVSDAAPYVALEVTAIQMWVPGADGSVESPQMARSLTPKHLSLRSGRYKLLTKIATLSRGTGLNEFPDNIRHVMAVQFEFWTARINENPAFRQELQAKDAPLKIAYPVSTENLQYVEIR